MPNPPPTLMFFTVMWWRSSRSCSSLTRLHNATKSPISSICEPIWKCSPTNSTCFNDAAISMTFSMSAMAMPNLFSASPVVILAWVCAPTSGLMRNETRAILSFSPANWLMTSSSGMLSTLKYAIPASSPTLISQSLFPTPANTILSAGNPASRQALISPPLTQSAPNPAAQMMRSSLRLALAFTA